MRIAQTALLVGRAQEHETSRYLLQKESHIFRAHGAKSTQDIPPTQHVLGNLAHQLRGSRIVDHSWRQRLDLQVNLHPHTCGDALT